MNVGNIEINIDIQNMNSVNTEINIDIHFNFNSQPWTKVTIRTGTIVHMRSGLFINFVVFHGHVRKFVGKRTKFINSSKYANSLRIKGKICTCCTYLPDTLNY